jgi:phosphoenolpyruvate carboxylase
LSETADEAASSPIMGDRDAPLRADVRTMGSLLGQIIRDHHGDAIFEKIEDLRALAKKWREAGAGRNPNKAEDAKKTFDELARLCSNLSDEELLIISRAFTHFLAIANSAEAHHRIRLLNQTETRYALPYKPDSCGGVLEALMEQGKTPEQIYECLITQQTELVLTAHPTEVNRRVILEKQRRVQEVRKSKVSLFCVRQSVVLIPMS